MWHQQYIQVIWNTCTYKWYCISYSGCNQDVPNFTIENEQQISRVSSYMYFTFGQASMNWKKLTFKINTDVYFSYSNSKWAVHKSSTCKCKLKMLCYKTKKCKSYLWPLLLLQPSYPSCKYNNWNAVTSKQSKQQNTCQDYIKSIWSILK